VVLQRRSFLAFAGASGLCGCAGAVHQLPQIDSGHLSLAQSEVQAAGGAPSRHQVSDQEVKQALDAALDRIRPAATQLCHEMRVGVCVWQFHLSGDRSLNANAGPGGVITVNRGIVEYAQNEEEVAVVIAHEMGHQMANHVATGVRNQQVGALAGTIPLGALGAVAGYYARDTTGTIAGQAAKAGGQLGGAVGRISFSKEQEREADYLAAVILYRSGMDLDKARGFMVTIARASTRKETGMLDSHPAGPERLAGWDKAVAEIRASNGRLPQRA
jgi:predicted Zn-dependent protease